MNRFDSDVLKEKLLSRFFLLLIKTKQNKTTCLFGKTVGRPLLVVLCTDAGLQQLRPEPPVLIEVTFLVYNGRLPVREKVCLMSAEFELLH